MQVFYLSLVAILWKNFQYCKYFSCNAFLYFLFGPITQGRSRIRVVPWRPERSEKEGAKRPQPRECMAN